MSLEKPNRTIPKAEPLDRLDAEALAIGLLARIREALDNCPEYQQSLFRVIQDGKFVFWDEGLARVTFKKDDEVYVVITVQKHDQHGYIINLMPSSVADKLGSHRGWTDDGFAYDPGPEITPKEDSKCIGIELIVSGWGDDIHNPKIQSWIGFQPMQINTWESVDEISRVINKLSRKSKSKKSKNRF